MSRETAYKTENRPFAVNLRRLLHSTGTTQKALAAAVGMKQQTISYYANGQSIPDIDGLVQIADFFGVTTDWLLARPNAPKTYESDISTAAATLNISEKAAQSARSHSFFTDALLASPDYESLIDGIAGFFTLAKNDLLDDIATPDALFSGFKFTDGGITLSRTDAINAQRYIAARGLDKILDGIERDIKAIRSRREESIARQKARSERDD